MNKLKTVIMGGVMDKTFLLKIGYLYSICIFFSLVATMAYTFILLTLYNYRVVLYSNNFGEHYIELFIIFSAIVIYLCTFRKYHVMFKSKEERVGDVVG